ncbi:D-amino-acid transaminase [Aliihoeflea aestuarii]|jgi:D-amino acid aminotransferase|uniref:D-amino-acid transaminase n=1 Tax=Aliihoeflea aestuarii TaxID=453840 RepID=UPI002094E5B1|nr:D-amino-acid transaminase [Aliihoeflea aestuarii]MCO6392986.1 D-amino-acid transaminase [Aliihoeflea aestuarii]
MRSVYVNGKWVPEQEAEISVFDRGFLFADAVYEVAAVIGGKLIDYPGHATRLGRSLHELGMAMPVSEHEMLDLHREAIRRNEVVEGLVYLQVTRGAADRDFLIDPASKPGLVMFTQEKQVTANPKVEIGLKVKCVPDLRWARRDIKTVQLLYSSLMKTEAAREGLDDVLLVEDGVVTEASSANLHIVDADGTIVTPPLSRALLPGITRGSVLSIARDNAMPVREDTVSTAALASAREVFITSATSFVMPVVEIDGRSVGEGVPGPITRRMRELYIAKSMATAT